MVWRMRSISPPEVGADAKLAEGNGGDVGGWPGLPELGARTGKAPSSVWLWHISGVCD
jgi:hypothetical protein